MPTETEVGDEVMALEVAAEDGGHSSPHQQHQQQRRSPSPAGGGHNIMTVSRRGRSRGHYFPSSSNTGDDAQRMMMMTSGNNNNDDEEGAAAGSFFTRPEEDIVDYSHLADDFKEPLHVYPSSDPSKKLKKAYASQKTARTKYDAFRKQRHEFELLGMADKLGELHNLWRESKEREGKARKRLRDKTVAAYELELQESPEKDEFNEWMGKLKVFVKKYKALPPSLKELEGKEDDPTYEQQALLARWVHDQQNEYSSLAPNQLGALQNLGVIFPLSEEDEWHRSLYLFQLYSKDYWDSPITVQSTNGDLIGSIMADEKQGQGALQLLSLQMWCLAQQEQYEQDGFLENMDRYTKLVNAGFTFDVIVDDDQWTEYVELVNQFKIKFAHVHIPEHHVPPNSNCTPEDVTKAAKLKEFIDKVRTLLHRDALSPKRLAHLKKIGLYMDMGGRVYDYHSQYCTLGRKEREGEGDEERIKRKFSALAVIAQQGQTVKKKPVVPRGNVNLWHQKLEKLVAYKEKHANVLDIQNDVKLRGWTFSVIRKLSINSATLRGEKMMLLEKHEGLKEFLLQSENVEAATADAKARKKLEELGSGSEWKGSEGGNIKGEETKDLEELTEDVLLGKEEDHEVNAFMESGDL